MSDNYWFPKKRYGWGPPRKLQGWTVLIGWIVLLTIGMRSLPGLSGIVFFIGMIALLGLIVYFKGEPPERGTGGRRSLKKLRLIALIALSRPIKSAEAPCCLWSRY